MDLKASAENETSSVSPECVRCMTRTEKPQMQGLRTSPALREPSFCKAIQRRDPHLLPVPEHSKMNRRNRLAGGGRSVRWRWPLPVSTQRFVLITKPRAHTVGHFLKSFSFKKNGPPMSIKHCQFASALVKHSWSARSPNSGSPSHWLAPGKT